MATQSLCPSFVGMSAHTDQKAGLGQRFDVQLSTGNRFVAVYAQIVTQATVAATDIVAWATYGSGTVTADTTGNRTRIAGIPMTGGTAAWALSSYALVQVWGGYILGPDGTTVFGNQLLGDGSVAAGESIMPSAGTDGMVDTWATDAGVYIGMSLEDDAPAITAYILNCLAAC